MLCGIKNLCIISGFSKTTQGINVNLIDEVEGEQLRSDIPEFSPGDSVVVQVKFVRVLASDYKPLKVWLLLRKIVV